MEAMVPGRVSEALQELQVEVDHRWALELDQMTPKQRAWSLWYGQELQRIMTEQALYGFAVINPRATPRQKAIESK